MENFAHDMSCVVRRLFPDDERLDPSNKRKRSSTFCGLSPSPLREYRKNANNSTRDVRPTDSERGNIYKRCGYISPISIQNNIFSKHEMGSQLCDATFVQSKNFSTAPAEEFLDKVVHLLNDRYPPDTDHLVIQEAEINDSDRMSSEK